MGGKTVMNERDNKSTDIRGGYVLRYNQIITDS